MLTKEQEQFVESLVNKQVTAIKTQYEGTITTLQAEVRSLKADLLYTEHEREQQRRNMAHGRGELHANGSRITKDDYAQVLPAKIQAHSLEEVLKMQALDADIDPRNERAFNAFLGVDKIERKQAGVST